MSETLLKQARIAAKQKQWPQLFQLAQNIIASGENTGEGYYFLGLAEKARRQYEAAFNAFQRAVKAAPNNHPARIEGAEILQRFGRHAEALAWVKKSTSAVGLARHS